MKNLVPFIEINLGHDYYNQGHMKEIRLIPERETAEFLGRFRMHQKLVNGVYSIFYDEPYDRSRFSDYLKEIIGEQILSFALVSSNPNFFILSDLPSDWNGELSFSSNEIGDDSIHLEMNLLKREHWLEGFVGTINIHPEQLFEEKPYKISIPVRKTFWHYYIINRSKTEIHTLVIKDKDTQITFEGPEEAILPDGEEALLFTSGKLELPYRETPIDKFDLINYPPGMADANNGLTVIRPLVKGLPVPSGNKVLIENHNNEKYAYSEMYIYI